MKANSHALTLIGSSDVDCLIREGSLDIVKEFRIGDLTSYSDHTILNIELVSDKSIEEELHKVQSEKA